MLLSRENGRIFRVAFTVALAVLWLFAVVQGQSFHHHEDGADHEESCPICAAMLATMLLVLVFVYLAPKLLWAMPPLAARFLPLRGSRAIIRLRGPPITV